MFVVPPEDEARLCGPSATTPWAAMPRRLAGFRPRAPATSWFTRRWAARSCSTSRPAKSCRGFASNLSRIAGTQGHAAVGGLLWGVLDRLMEAFLEQFHRRQLMWGRA